MFFLFSRSLLVFRLADGLKWLAVEFGTVFGNVFGRWGFSPIPSVNESQGPLCCIVIEVLIETGSQRVVQLFLNQ